ncbi:MAG: hypothetical protein HQM10_16055 [Candidatus Riflebacteria bacterium]|nr:hypothetical protein [Candidatus Riflebacteria bacterium]
MNNNQFFFDGISGSNEHSANCNVAKNYKVYADLPHRYFSDIESMKNYVIQLQKLGVNVLLLLPHFFPSFSEYVVKDYERPANLFGNWEHFSDFMNFVREHGMDRMIDIPFNHADWMADNLKREWFINHWSNGTEAGADDMDADGNRVRINWGAYILDNSNKDLIEYWLQKVIYPHVEKYCVNAIRIDAAWGLDRNGLSEIIGKTKSRFPKVWFLAENLGMDKLINLAESGIKAGAERFFNNYFWHSNGRGVPIDYYRFFKRSKGLPTCTIFSNHDVLMPAMRALSKIKKNEYAHLNDRALYRQIIERDGIDSPQKLSENVTDRIQMLMKLDFCISAFLSTDIMIGAGSERLLIEKTDVLLSNSDSFAKGINTGFSDFMKMILKLKASDEIFHSEGVVIPIGNWSRSKDGIKGYVKRFGKRHLMVAANTNLDNAAETFIPATFRKSGKSAFSTDSGIKSVTSDKIPEKILLKPGQALALFQL